MFRQFFVRSERFILLLQSKSTKMHLVRYICEHNFRYEDDMFLSEYEEHVHYDDCHVHV